MMKGIFKCELSFKKLREVFRLTLKVCAILNVQYLSFTKVPEMEGVFDKTSLIVGTKLNLLKNFLLRVK